MSSVTSAQGGGGGGDAVGGGADAERAPALRVFRWTGANSYFMHCSDDAIAMGGGGGAFGLCVEDAFARGSTGACATYGNGPLCAAGTFEVLNFECFGFTAAASDAELARETAARGRRARARAAAGR